MGRKYTEEELKEKREIKYKANGEFDKIDYSLEEDLMDAEFDTLNARLKAKLAGSDGPAEPAEPDEVDSDIDDILAEQPQEPKKAKTVTDDEDIPF